MGGSTLRDDIERLLHQARSFQQREQPAAARSAYEAVLALDAAQPIVLNGLGMLALRVGDTSAVRWFEQAAQFDPTAGPIWLNLATARRAKADTPGERDALERALALDQRNVMASFRLAELLERIGEGQAAFERWQGLVMMLAGSSDRPASLDAVLTTAIDKVAAHGARLGEAIDHALERQRLRLGKQERHRMEACIDAMLGRRRIYLNECHGLHFPFLPADEFFDRSQFPWMEELEAATPAIVDEVQGLLSRDDSGFAPYVSLASGSPENRWTPLDNSTRWSARYLWRFGVVDDGVCDSCPHTVAALRSVPRMALAGQAPTAFFSVLEPGTRLPPHTGVSNVRAIVHLPLIVPAGCGFRVGGESRPWQVGQAFAFDDTIEHEAWNEGDSIRAVLIFDTWNPHLTVDERSMLGSLFTAMQSMEGGAPSIAD